MGVIQPTSSGRTYKVWKLSYNFIHYTNDLGVLDSLFDPALRLAIINACWSTIESFVRGCVIETIHTNYDKLNLPTRYKVFTDGNLDQLMTKDNYIRAFDYFDWGKLKSASIVANHSISSLQITTQDFLNKLYDLRNGFMHGNEIKIMKSRVQTYPDEISNKYVKSVKYLDDNGVISMESLIDSQNIEDLLNSKTTDFIIRQMHSALDEIANLYAQTYEAKQWLNNRS